MPGPRIVSCPRCGESVKWIPEATWRPFCSERCKVGDLGAWANESYRVPLHEDQPELDPDPPPGGAQRR